MRIKKLFTLIFIMISAYIITSCAATQPREKMLVGTWTPLKVSPYVPNNQKLPAITGKKVTDTKTSGKQNSEQTPSAADTDEKKEKQIEHHLDLMMRTTLKINVDKTCVIQSPGKSINAKWKLKNKGTNLIIKEHESGKIRTLELVLLNDTAAMVIQRTIAGDFIARFRKQ